MTVFERDGLSFHYPDEGGGPSPSYLVRTAGRAGLARAKGS